MGVSTVILFARNVGDPASTARTCRMIREVAGRPIVISIDQEGGSSRRLTDGFTHVPSMRTLAAGGEHAVAEAARTTARELREVGIDLDFAPVVDVDSNPENPVIGTRSFSPDPQLVARLGAAWIRAMQAESVAACAKHFPGHGAVVADSHVALPEDHRGYADILEDMLPSSALSLLCSKGSWSPMSCTRTSIRRPRVTPPGGCKPNSGSVSDSRAPCFPMI